MWWKLILIVCFSFFIIFPILTLLHELGHALVPLGIEKSKVSIRVGPNLTENQKPIIKFSTDRIKVQWTSFWKPWQGYCGWSFLSNDNRKLTALLLGPATSLFLILIFTFCLFKFWNHSIYLNTFFFSISICACIQFFVTATPMQYPSNSFASNKVSDGYQIKAIIQKKISRSLASSRDLEQQANP